MDMNDDKTKPRNLLGWRGEIAATQQERGLRPDPVPARVTTITAPGEARAPALVRDALNPQNLAANRAEALPFLNQTSGPRFAPDGTGSRQGGARPAAPAAPAAPATGARSAPVAAAAPAAAAAAPAPPVAKLGRTGRPPAGAPGVEFNTGQPGDVGPPTQPNIGYFIGSDGTRRDITANQAESLAGRVTSVPAPVATPAAAPAQVGAPGAVLQRPDAFALSRDAASLQRAEAGATRRDAEAFLNPMSMSAEAMRRLENSQNSYFSKGSPSARAFAAEAILGQLRAGNNASALRQQQVGETVAAGAAQEAGLGAVAAEGAATRAAAATESAQRAQLQREQLDAAGPILQLQGGLSARVGRDGVVRTLVGEDGKPVRGQADVKALDPNEVFKAAATQRGDIANNPLLDPETRAAALAEFDAGPLGQALAAALPSSPQGAPPSRPTFEQLKAANPNVSDTELRAYFDREYGSTQ